MKIEEFNIIKNYPILHDYRITDRLVNSNLLNSEPDLKVLSSIFNRMKDEIDYAITSPLNKGIEIFFVCRNRKLDFHVMAGQDFKEITFKRHRHRTHDFNNKDLEAIDTFLAEYIEEHRTWT